MKKIHKVIIYKIVGLFAFLLIIVIMNYLLLLVDYVFFARAVQFFNNNLAIFIMVHVVLGIAEAVDILPKPYAYIAPMFNAAGAILLVMLLLRILELMDEIIGFKIFSYASTIELFLYPVIFIVVIIVSFVSVFQRDQ